MIHYICHYPSLLGEIIMASDGESLTGLWFAGQKHYGEPAGGLLIEKDLPVFRETTRWLDLYFGGEIPDFTPLLSVSGTEFRQAVWRS